MENRNYGIDFLKFIAAIMITNSHYQPLYEGHNISFATLGVQGNALFFFVSGLFLINIENKEGKYVPFNYWIRKKLVRLWPTLIIFYVFGNLIFSLDISWFDFLLAGDYWFVRCFLVSFSIIYFVLKYLKQYTKQILVLSVLITSVIIIFSPKEIRSIYHEFHYIIYFSSMLLGVNVGLFKNQIKFKNLFSDLVLCGLSFLLYFIIMFFGKGKTDNLYYIQLLAVFPLLFFLYYSYKVVNYQWCVKLSNYKIWSAVFIVSSLTYEIYIVQFNIISNSFNKFYPLNTVIVFVIIVFSALILRILTNFFLWLFSTKELKINQIFRL